MNLELTNFAKVGHVNVCLDGLTVIAGKNSTGKSTISRVLMTYFTVLRRMGEHIRRARMHSMVEQLHGLLDLPSATHWRLSRIIGHGYFDFGEDLFHKSFWTDPEALIDLLKRSRVMRDDSESVGRLDLERMVQEKFPAVRKAISAILDRADEEYEELIFRTVFNKVFRRQICPLGDVNAIASLKVMDGARMEELDIHGESLLKWPKGAKSAFRSVLYMEPINILDVIGDDGESELDDRYDAGEQCWSSVLRAKRYLVDNTLETDKKIQRAKEVLKSAGNIIGGNLEDFDGDLKFKDEKIDEPIELLNLASGAKSVSMLLKALGNGALQPGDLLIGDEPESNLHPEWQVKFAELLVLVRKELGIKVLLNTHSPYFLKAIETFSKKFGVQDSAHYYFMKAEGGRATGEEITDDLTVAYEALYKPLAGIMEA